MRAERRDIRRLLEQLTAEQWQHPSLCDAWSVRDVVAHLVGWDEVLLYRTPRQHAAAAVRFVALYGTSLASMRLVNRRIRRRTRHLDPAALIRRFAADDGPELRWLFDGTNPGAHLAEYLIHHQDIRRPLGLAGAPSPDRVTRALEGVTQLPGVRLTAWWRLRRARLEATDVDWSRGRGPVHRMTGEAALMWLAGRST